jgi:hypothetical protein
LGIVVATLGGGAPPLILGQWTHGPAWSTIKVPLVIAAQRDNGSSKITDAMTAAITHSDNAAAEELWQSLGDSITAASKVQSVLAGAGDPTAVQWQKIRPGFSAFGQTDWSLIDQAQFAAAAACDTRDAAVFELMGDIASDQRWGLGAIPESRFKGGWGPDPGGNYLVRQFGIITTPAGFAAVAIAAHATLGSFADGTATLTALASWLVNNAESLPAGHCRA